MVPFLRAQGVGAIITLFGKSIELTPVELGFQYLFVEPPRFRPLSDLEPVLAFIDTQVERSRGALVHCFTGIVALEPFWLGGLFVKTPSCRRRLPWRGAVMHIFPSMRGFAFRSIRLRRKFSVASIENARS